MIKALALEGFQSWDTTRIEFAPVTVFVGRGNSGKTAILRAIKYALTNQTGDDFIRAGVEGCVVGLAFDRDGVVWSKEPGKGGVYHTVNHEYTKTAGKVPDEITALGMREVEIDSSLTIFPQIQMQFDKPFLVAETPAVRARILGKLTRLHVLIGAQQACAKDARRWEREAGVHEKGIAGLDAELDKYPALEPLWERFRELEHEEAEIHTEVARCEQAQLALLALGTGRSLARLAKHVATYTAQQDELQAELERLQLGRHALSTWADSIATLADSGIRVDALAEQRRELEAEYETLCRSAGVCDTCPWREA